MLLFLSKEYNIPENTGRSESHWLVIFGCRDKIGARDAVLFYFHNVKKAQPNQEEANMVFWQFKRKL